MTDLMANLPPIEQAEPYVIAWIAAKQAGVHDRDIAQAIQRAARKATGLTPIRTRLWLGSALSRAQTDGRIFSIQLDASSL